MPLIQRDFCVLSGSLSMSDSFPWCCLLVWFHIQALSIRFSKGILMGIERTCCLAMTHMLIKESERKKTYPRDKAAVDVLQHWWGAMCPSPRVAERERERPLLGETNWSPVSFFIFNSFQNCLLQHITSWLSQLHTYTFCVIQNSASWALMDLKR